MMKEAPEHQRVVLHGHYFHVEMYNSRALGILVDVTRNYSKVAKFVIPASVRKVPNDLDAYFRKIVRIVLAHYGAQQKMHEYGCELLEGVALTADEKKAATFRPARISDKIEKKRR